MKDIIKKTVLVTLLAYLAITALNLLREQRYQQLENKYQMCINREVM